MKLVRADIFGFGKWVDVTFHFPNQSLICFYGENESGKTTLQQFIIYMLFGFPPRKRVAFQPKMSSKLGGRLILNDPSIGQFSIERLDGELTCHLPDGTIEGEQWLNERLKGMNEKMYRSIYSFSALDLSDIQEMKDESLSEILFSIGLTGATNIYTLERNIDNKIGNLFKPTGRVPAINKQLTTLDELHKKLAQYEREESEYRVEKEHQFTLVNRLNDLEKKLQAFKEKLFTYEKIRHALPTIRDFHHCRQQLKQFPPDLSFPENGIERLNELKKELIPLQSEFALLQENERQYEQTIANIKDQLHESDEYEFALNLLNEKQRNLKNKQAIQSIESQLQEVSRDIDEMIHHLNINLSEGDIENISLPFQIETTFIQLSKEDELLQLEKEQLTEEEHLLLRKKEKLNDDQSILLQKMMPDEQVQSLKAKLSQDEKIKDQLRDQHVRKKEWLEAKNSRLKNSKILFLSSIIFSLICFVISFTFKYTFLNVVAIIIVLVSILQQFLTKRSINEIERLIVDKTSPSLKGNQLSTKERLHIEKLIDEQNRYKSELHLIEQSLKELHIEQLQWEERELLFRQKKAKHDMLIDEQCEKFSFLKNVAVSHWLDLLESLKQLKRRLEMKNELNEKRTQIKSEIIHFNHLLKQFFERINGDGETIEHVEKWIEREKDLKREKKQYEQLLGELLKKQSKVERKIDYYQIEINELYKMATVENEEQFFEIANQIKERESLLEKKETCYQQLSLTFSERDKLKVIDKPLNENDVQLKMEMLKNKIDETERLINENRDKLAEVEANLKQMESSDKLSEIVHHVEIEQQKLNELVFDWTVLQLAKTALQKSKRAYRDKYLTEVIDKTSSYFSFITNGVYEKVFAPTSTDPFLVQTKDYTRYDVNELSQGTIDQLYVSLRLAISEVMSERYNVPFIIDDAFVHFDFKRTKNIVDILRKIGEKQQVIFFTCKEDIKRLIPEEIVIQIDHSNMLN